jgi:hypothetical protein
LRVDPEEIVATSNAGTDVEEPQAIRFEVTSVTGCSEAIWRIGVCMLKVPAWSTGAGPLYLLPLATMLPTYPCPRTVVAAKRTIIGSKVEQENGGDIAFKAERYGSNQDAPGDLREGR